MKKLTRHRNRSWNGAAFALPLALALAACGAEPDMDADDPAAGDPAAAPGDPGEAPEPPPAALVPEGTVLVFEVMEDVSTATHEAGDSFDLRLVEAVEGRGGARLAAGSEAQGVVTAASRSTGPDEEPLLGVRIESVEVNGSAHPVVTTVVSADLESARGASDARTAATIVTGAAAGAVVGQILGRDTRSTVAGAAAGAIAGTGIALTARSGDAVLPEGARITAELSDPLVMH